MRALGRLLAGYALALAASSGGAYYAARLAPVDPARATVVTSRWLGGVLAERTTSSGAPAAPPLPGAVRERVVAEGPLSAEPHLLAVSLRPGLDGVRATLDGREALVTVDDLLAAGAYERALVEPTTGLGAFTDAAAVYALLAARLGAPADEVRRRARLTRIEVRRAGDPSRPPPVASLEAAAVERAVHDLAYHLARRVDLRGTYAYEVSAQTGVAAPSYSWPRHAGATYFLAQAAGRSRDLVLVTACARAAAALRDLVVACGAERCVAADTIADVGSSALAVLALVEVDRAGVDAASRDTVRALARFLRAQQRPDGELMHLYDRRAGRPIDAQALYFTGEAALALARAHVVTGDPADLASAERALAYLGRSWRFFGSRYYFGEEHWTCQAAAELRDRPGARGALDLCRGYLRFSRALQYGAGETPFDARGGFGVGPLFPPRVTAAASRAEALGALLSGLAPDDPDRAWLEASLAEALEFVLRRRLGADVSHLFASPSDAVGRLPPSEVDWQLRVDYEQHAGSALVRWLELRAPR